MINVAVLGYGTVGSGVVEVIRENAEIIKRQVGEEIKVKYVLDLRDFEGDPVQEILVHDYKTILEDPEVKIVVEVMGGVEPAHTFVKDAILAGKSACTSNKEMVAKHGAELIALAKEKGVNFLYEASVGGGIPILRALMTSLTCDDIDRVYGILNGTTNYMLTKMQQDSGADYDKILKDAQDKGYAERNPEADVEGYDACRKIAIISSLVTGQQVNYEDIHTEGITKITATDFAYAKSLGGTIKLLGVYEKKDGVHRCMVAPMIVKEESPLYPVQDVFNAVCVHGNMLDDVMFYGRGAGKLPTASAVVADVVELAKHPSDVIRQNWSDQTLTLGSFDTWEHSFLVRIKTEGKDVKDEIAKAFGKVEYLQTEIVSGEEAFVTGEITEKQFADAVSTLSNVTGTLRLAR